MPDERPNILLITGDHLNWNTICDRSPCRTPNANRLAEEGMRFDRSYTPISLCCPARAMLLSGAYPWHNGVFNQVHVPESVHPDMFEDVVTYSERLIEAGYRAAYAGKWHASTLRGPADFGYEKVPVASPGDMELADVKSVTWPGGSEFPMWGTMHGNIEESHEARLARAAAAEIGEMAGNDESPWLLEVHFPQPHDPYYPYEQFLERYDPEDIELPESYYEESFEDKPDMLRREAECWRQLSEEDFREGIRHYYAYCEQLDYCIGQVLDALDKSGDADNTLVVLTADHGDLLGAHRMFIKGWMPYEEAHRIPMIARLPGLIPAGSKTDQLVHLHDWAHTFVAQGGAEPLPYEHGKDLTPLLNDPRQGDENMPSHILNCYYGGEFIYTQRIAIGQRYKYVFNGFAMDEFYDLQEDPAEVHNVIDDPDYADAVRNTRDALWELMIGLDDPYAQHRYGAGRYLPGHSEGLNLEHQAGLGNRRGQYHGHWEKEQ